MSEIKLDIPNILVVVDNGDQYNVNLTTPTTINTQTSNTFFTVADFATLASSSVFATTASYALSSAGVIVNAISASFATTSSYALNAGAGAGFPFSGSAVITGSLLVSGGNIAGTLFGTASLTQAIIGGKSRYIPLWTGSAENELTSSIMYQTSTGIFIGYDTHPHFHSLEGETLAVHSGETGVKNVIYAHGTFNDDYRVNIRNISSGVSASTNYKATSDVGDDIGGFIEMGINSSTYARTDQIGGPLDAYLFTTGSDLLIGTLSPEKRIVLFTGPGNATNNARVYIDPAGSVGINTSEVIEGAPDALRVKAVPSVSTFNVITALGLTDDYAQINMKNMGVGNSVSSDIVATANNGDENTNYVNMGINGETYTGTIGGANDSYVYSTGGHLHLGVIDPGEDVRLFVGGNDTTLTTKLTLRDTNQHELSGSLNVTGSLNVLEGVINNLTASFAMTASYVSGAISTWDDLLNKPANLVSSSQQVKDFLPPGTVSSSQQATSWTVLSASFASTASSINFTPATASFAISASFAPTNPGVVSSSTQINYAQLQNIPSGIVSSSTQINTGSFTGTFIGTSSWANNSISSSFALTASYVSGAASTWDSISNKPAGLVSSSTQINTGSFSGSFTGTFFGTSSWATNAISSSFATTASFSVSSSRTTTASFGITSSYAFNADLLDGINSTVFATTGSNTFVGNQTITGSLFTNADTLLFTGSIFTSGSISVTGGTITSSLFGTASRAITSSYTFTASFVDGGFY